LAPSGRQTADSLEHFAGVALHAHFVPDFLNFAIRTDQKSAPYDSFENPAHEFLRAPDAIFFDHLVSRIAQQRKIEFLLFLEVGQSLFRVRTRAQDNDILLIEVLLCVAKLGRFCRSTRRVGLGKEK
jgi:hypothetical protein